MKSCFTYLSAGMQTQATHHTSLPIKHPASASHSAIDRAVWGTAPGTRGGPRLHQARAAQGLGGRFAARTGVHAVGRAKLVCLAPGAQHASLAGVAGGTGLKQLHITLCTVRLLCNACHFGIGCIVVVKPWCLYCCLREFHRRSHGIKVSHGVAQTRSKRVSGGQGC